MKYRRFVALAGAAVMFFGAAFSVAAQESGSDLGSLFGDEVLTQPGQDQSAQQGAAGTAQGSSQSTGGAAQPAAPASSTAASADPLAGLLKTEAVKIGGSITGKIDTSWTWTDPWASSFDLANPDKSAIAPTLSSLVYFDARPEDAFRVHGSFKTAWPFSSAKTFLTSATWNSLTSSVATTSGSVTTPNISVFELFSDFQLGDSVYFRFGKATVKWGVGYFFSPADIINLEPINFLDPTAQREGPVQFRVYIPYGSSQNTLSFYAIFPNNATPDFANTALAGKAEFVFGNYELGLSAYYRNDTTERAAATLTGPAGPFDVFAEAVVAWGSPKTFYTFSTSAPYYSSSTPSDHRDTLYPSATAGLLYNDQNNIITAIAQYYYNGEGYSETDRSSATSALQTLLTSMPASSTRDALTGLGQLFALFSGQHYGAANVTFSDIGGSNFSASALGIMNFSDFSGFARPSVSWQIADYLNLSLYANFVFGADNTEYGFLAQGRPVTIGLTLSAGTGNF